jgi:hypothetical protein
MVSSAERGVYQDLTAIRSSPPSPLFTSASLRDATWRGGNGAFAGKILPLSAERSDGERGLGGEALCPMGILGARHAEGERVQKEAQLIDVHVLGPFW